MKKKRNLLVPLCILLSILYIILASRPLATELQFLPQWTIDTTKITISKDNKNLPSLYENAIPFKSGQTLGYFTSDGDILNIVSFPYKSALCSSFYALYGTNDKKIPFYAPSGEKKGEIAHTGFPFFMEDKLYLFLPGGSAFSKLNDEGKIQWSYESYAFAPGGSEYPVILGADISNSGALIACVSGQERQRFILAKKASNHTAIIHHEYLEKPATRQLLVKFSQDESTVYFDSEDGLGIVDCASGKSRHIAINGHILSICESPENKVTYILSRGGDTYTVHAIEPFATFAGAFSFKAESACIAVDGNNLFVGRNNKISKITVTHQ